MSHQPCPCADLLQATDAEQKEAMEQLRACAKEATATKVKWHTDIAVASRAKKNVHLDFTLCQRCVVASPEEQVPEPDTQ